MLVRAWEPVNTGERLQDLIVLPVKSAGLQNMFVFSAFSTYSILLHDSNDCPSCLQTTYERKESTEFPGLLDLQRRHFFDAGQPRRASGLSHSPSFKTSSTKAVVNEDAGRSKLPGT